MKHIIKFWIAAFVAAVFFLGCSQEPNAPYSIENISPPEYMLQGGKDHFDWRLPQIDEQPILKGGVLLAGDSITEGWLDKDIDLGAPISNHGIGWDTVTGLRARLPQMLRHSPDKVFILIGTNDIGYDRKAEVMAEELSDIVQSLQREWPEIQIYIQGVMPRELGAMLSVDKINTAYRKLAAERGVTYIDLEPVFAASDRTLKPNLTYDGLHLNAEGYRVWAKTLKPYIEN